MKGIMIAMLARLIVCMIALAGAESQDETPVTEEAEQQEVLREPYDIIVGSDDEGNPVKKYIYLIK